VRLTASIESSIAMSDTQGAGFEQDSQKISAEEREDRQDRTTFLRRRTAFSGLAAACFLLACLGGLFLFAVFHWPKTNVLVYYFIVRPAFVWFGALGPPLAIGVFGVRFRWFVLGCFVFGLLFLSSSEILHVARPFPARAREEFAAAHMGYASARKEGTTDELDRMPLRLLTWNIAGSRFGAEGAVERLARMAPDIIFLQEAGGGEKLSPALMRHEFFRGYHLGSGGRKLISRFPLERISNVALHKYRADVWRLNVAGKSVTCVNVHLSRHDLRTQLVRGFTWAGLQKAVARTRRELSNLQLTLNRYAYRGTVIVAGDFNLPPRYPELLDATRGWKECFAKRGFGWGGTAPAKLPALRVDMIFVPADARVYYAGAVPTGLSDHYMMFADVMLPLREAAQESELPSSSPGKAGLSP
jgi:endonuclease/exonuclease/phosphatase family metal-dependent hydrolase